MSTKDKFNAAVNVIRGLPKRGSYQPSKELMLRFYSYYKQATEGKCNAPKPGFWDVVNRAKWEAWNRLGDMSSEEAMQAYVDELHKIVETMSYTDNVAAFFDTMDDSSDIPISKNDLYLVAGDVFKPSTPTDNGDKMSVGSANDMRYNGYLDSEDEYIDTEEQDDVPKHTNASNGHIPNSVAATTYIQTTYMETNNQVLDDLRKTVTALERDMAQLRGKLDAIHKEQRSLQKSILFVHPKWWPLKRVSPAIIAVFVVWPFLANRIAYFMKKKK